jgi:hypothetical protein
MLADPAGGETRLMRPAVQRVVEEASVRITLPFFGDVALPPVDHLLWYAAVAVLALAGILEWPVAFILAAGKALADNRSHRAWQEFGLALEQAL